MTNLSSTATNEWEIQGSGMLAHLSYITTPFATHQPVLIELIKKTTGDIIELGCGDNSTKLILHLIKDTGRKLVSLESDKDWHDKFLSIKNKNHTMLFVDAGKEDIDSTGEFWVDYIKNNDLLQSMKFEICLVDQSPWSARTHSIKHFRDSVKYLLVHDVDFFPSDKRWGSIKSKEIRGTKVRLEMYFDDIVKNYKVYYPPFEYFRGNTGPPTLLCSNLATRKEFEALNIDVSKYYKDEVITLLKINNIIKNIKTLMFKKLKLFK